MTKAAVYPRELERVFSGGEMPFHTKQLGLWKRHSVVFQMCDVSLNIIVM